MQNKLHPILIKKPCNLKNSLGQFSNYMVTSRLLPFLSPIPALSYQNFYSPSHGVKRIPNPLAIRSPPSMLALGVLKAASRRLRTAGWRGYAAAAAALITAVATLSAFAVPSPVTDHLVFSVSGSLSPDPTVWIGSAGGGELKDSADKNYGNVVNSSSEELKAPPLDLEELIISPVFNEGNSSSAELGAPPLDPEELAISIVKSNVNEVTSSPLSPTENFATNQVGSSDGDRENAHLQPKVPAGSTTINPPPFLVPPPSTGKPSTNEGPISLTEADWQVIYAKKKIGRSPVISDDLDLYAPLFRNVSVFKRSYELMEKILKIYIYQDGKRPIFHTFTPVLKGIYASEGWFMKLMESNRNFVVKDPNKAHLFYLPYSARQLEVTLYKPDSHNLRPLAIFLKNYVDWISSRYPFWNRTRGADHFLVACHDWGPYTTRLHTELSQNTIKALCNADLSEGFIQGKDVSLPETLIKNPRKPLRGLGGKPVSKRSILAFFAGNMHGRVRPILLDYWNGKDEDMKIYGPLPPQVSRKMSYSEHMKSSKFCICPMGYEVNSPRIVEAIYYECVPVIIADNFVLPFNEVLDWSAFSVVVAEKDIPNLKDILLKISSRKYVFMHENVKRLQRHFLWHPRPVKYDLFHMILHSIWFNRLNQIQVNQ